MALARMLSKRTSGTIGLVLGLLALGCTEDRKVLSSPPDGGVCMPIEVDGSVVAAPAEGVNGDGPALVGAPLRVVGRLSGCVADPLLDQDAATCSNTSDPAECWNPFFIADGGTLSEQIMRIYGPCACLVEDAETP